MGKKKLLKKAKKNFSIKSFFKTFGIVSVTLAVMFVLFYFGLTRSVFDADYLSVYLKASISIVVIWSIIGGFSKL